MVSSDRLPLKNEQFDNTETKKIDIFTQIRGHKRTHRQRIEYDRKIRLEEWASEKLNQGQWHAPEQSWSEQTTQDYQLAATSIS